jgi:hypothetical protein
MPLLLPTKPPLPFQLVAPFEPLHLSGSIYHSTLPREKWMALTANLNLQYLLGGAGDKGIATRANYLGIIIILRMNLVLH